MSQAEQKREIRPMLRAAFERWLHEQVRFDRDTRRFLRRTCYINTGQSVYDAVSPGGERESLVVYFNDPDCKFQGPYEVDACQWDEAKTRVNVDPHKRSFEPYYIERALPWSQTNDVFYTSTLYDDALTTVQFDAAVTTRSAFTAHNVLRVEWLRDYDEQEIQRWIALDEGDQQ